MTPGANISSSSRVLIAAGLALLCGLAVQMPHLVFGRVHASDDWAFHYNLAREYAAALSFGEWRPGWSYGAEYGLGQPAPLYYAPLYYMAVAQVARLTGNVWLAMQGVEIAAAAVMGLGVYALAARHMAHRPALIAIALAILSPMLCLINLGLNAYPWGCALAPLAWLIWALLRPEAQSRAINIPAIVALAATIMTHTVTGLMAVIVTAALVMRPLVIDAHRGDWSAIAAPALTVVWALGLTAAYLYPAYSLQHLIDAEFLRGLHNPLATFSLPVFHSAEALASLIQWPVSLLLVGTCLLALFHLRPLVGAPWLASAALIVATAAILSSELAAPLWLLETPLRNVQFPFRFMAILVPLAPVLALAAYRRPAPRAARLLLAGLAVANLALAAALIVKAATTDGRAIDARETVFRPYPGLNEYRPRSSLAAARPGSAGFDWNGECARATAVCGDTRRTAGGLAWTVTAARDAPLVLPIHAFPAWRLSVDGVPQAATVDRRTGLVAMTVPAGRHSVSLAWHRFPAESRGAAISFAAALLLAAAGLIRIRRRAAAKSAA